MLEIAVQSGTTDIVATPHANSEFPFRPEVVQKKFAELKAAANGLIRLHLGCDFHIQFENVQDALSKPQKYTINNGPYLMVELPDVMSFPVIREILNRLQHVGITPIITHPERLMQLQSQPEEIRRWVEERCLVQITGQSLTGRFGNSAQQCASYLLKQGLVHFVASDAHDTRDRTPKLSEAFEWVSSRFGAKRAERLFLTNPAAVIAGNAIYDEEAYEEQFAGKRWWRIW